MKRWKKPCNTCKGQFPNSCLICGWKKEKGKRDPDDPELSGLRETVDHLHKLMTFRTTDPDYQSFVVSSRVNQHREWLHKLYLRHKVGRESLNKLCHETEVTEKMMKDLMSTYGSFLRRKKLLDETKAFLLEVLRHHLAGYRDNQLCEKFNIPLSVAVGVQRKDVFQCL